MSRIFRLLLTLVVGTSLTGCLGYRLVKPSDVEIPSYEPRVVLVPEACESLIGRAASDGMAGFQEREASMLDFCQNQQIIRAQEEEAASKRLEAHAEVANFALRATVVVVGAAIAILSWVF